MNATAETAITTSDLVAKRNGRRQARRNNHAPIPLDVAPEPFDMPPNAIVLNANKHGFGDAMVTAWISEGSKGTDRPLIHHAIRAKADLLRLFGQVVTPSPEERMETTFFPGGREVVGMRMTRLAHRASYLRAGGEPCRPRVIELSREVQDWADRTSNDRTIALFPQAAHTIRIWPVAYWLELYRLLQAAGWSPVFMLGHDDGTFRHMNSLSYLPWEHALAIIQRSRLVVTNSSGPAHVCGTMDHPTLVVCGPTDPKIAFGHLDSLNCVYEESMPCVRCHYRAPKARAACWAGCEALYRLSPQTIFDEAINMLSVRPLYEPSEGMWRQVSRERIEYGDEYFAKYQGYAETELGRQLTSARVELVKRHGCESVLDVGIGCGAFIEAFGQAQGFDVMPAAVGWLKERGLFRSPYSLVSRFPGAITCWDSLEHIEQPDRLLTSVKPGMHLFVSLPIFKDHDDIRASKHYRPGEHLTYWTDQGLRDFCAREGLALVESSQIESDLGRESIGTYVFKRPDVLPVEKTAYIVSGPRPSGNRLMASILVRSGCGGSGSTLQPKTVDELTEATGPFVIIQHASLHEWVPALRERGYERIVVLVVIREPVANLSSMTTRGHYRDIATARDQRARGIALTVMDALGSQAELEFVTYEGLTEASLKEWLPTIGLPYVPGALELVGQDAPSQIENVNAAHYGGVP
jgi:hypothetical protein